MKRFNIDDVRALLMKERESDEPDAILEVLKAHAGKRYTVHLLRKLPGGEERWGYRHVAGMTHLEERDYLRSSGNRGISLLVSYDTSGPHVVDAAWVEEKNPANYKGRRERNAQRDEALKNPALLERMCVALNSYARVQKALDDAKEVLDGLTGYGMPFSADGYDWERMCGAREERKS